MNIAEARDNAGARVAHHPTGRIGTITGFTGLVRVFVRYDDGTADEWGTLPEELHLIDETAVATYERQIQAAFDAEADHRDCCCCADEINPFCKTHS